MKPFQVDALPPEAFDVDGVMRRMKCNRADAESLVGMLMRSIVYTNDEYQVNVSKAEVRVASWPAMTHLSIKRKDKQPIHDWRVMQAIKNEIMGPEHEAVELYPAESRITDTANQYHLWVLTDPAQGFPFGYFDGRNVVGAEEAAKSGAVQRDFDEEVAAAQLSRAAGMPIKDAAAQLAQQRAENLP